jgi:hypothetical protein
MWYNTVYIAMFPYCPPRLLNSGLVRQSNNDPSSDNDIYALLTCTDGAVTEDAAVEVSSGFVVAG